MESFVDANKKTIKVGGLNLLIHLHSLLTIKCLLLNIDAQACAIKHHQLHVQLTLFCAGRELRITSFCLDRQKTHALRRACKYKFRNVIRPVYSVIHN